MRRREEAAIRLMELAFLVEVTVRNAARKLSRAAIPAVSTFTHGHADLKSNKIQRTAENVNLLVAWQKYDFIGLTFYAYKMNRKVNYFGQASPLKSRYLLLGFVHLSVKLF